MMINPESRFASLGKLYDFATNFAKVAQIASGPAFELQFNISQNALIDRMNGEIESLQNGVDTKSATAFLKVQLNGINSRLVDIEKYKALTDKRVSRIKDTLTNLTDLKANATPGTVPQFDTLLAQTIDLIEKTDTPINIKYGINDKLRTAKTDALSQLKGLVHNNFATQADIDSVTATLNAIQSDYLFSQSIVSTNKEVAYNLSKSGTSKSFDLSTKITDIEIQATLEVTQKVKEKQEQTAQLLSALSLSFDIAQEFTKFMSDTLTQPPKSIKGTVVDLVS